jgi:hypothetical protein
MLMKNRGLSSRIFPKSRYSLIARVRRCCVQIRTLRHSRRQTWLPRNHYGLDISLASDAWKLKAA